MGIVFVSRNVGISSRLSVNGSMSSMGSGDASPSFSTYAITICTLSPDMPIDE